MNNITFSIIIPCYNGWKYFSKCLDSLEKQTVKPDQVIIVDDCSFDDSFEKLVDYAEKSELNILVIKNDKNSGPSVSRKNGLDNATSSFVLFCDCDDWYDSDTIEKLKTTIETTKADLIIFDNFKIINDHKEKAEVTKNFISSSKSEIIALYPMSLWRFCVSYALLKDVYFPPLYNGEDGAVAPQIIGKANNIIVLEDAFYNYFFRENSTSMKPSEKAYLDMLEAFKVAKEYTSNEYEKEIEFLGIKFVCIAATLSAFKTGVKSKVVRSFIKEFNNSNPNWDKNKYIKSLAKSRGVYLWFLKRNFLLICRWIANVHTVVVKHFCNI